MAHLRAKAGELDDVTKQLLEAAAAAAAPQAPAASTTEGGGVVEDPPAAVVAAGSGGGQQGVGAAVPLQDAGEGEKGEADEENSEEDKKALSALDEFLARQEGQGGGASMRRAIAAKSRGSSPY